MKIYFNNSGVREPTERESNRVFENPQGKIKLPCPLGREQYEQDWLYFMFYSQSGCTVNLLISFHDEERPKFLKQEKKLINLDVVDEEELLVI